MPVNVPDKIVLVNKFGPLLEIGNVVVEAIEMSAKVVCLQESLID